MKPSFLITDTKSKVLYASPTCRDRAGFDIPEIVGKKPGELWGGLMPKSYYERFWATINRGGPYIGRLENRKKNGERFLDHVHVAAVHDEVGEIKYFVEMHPGGGEEVRNSFREAFLAMGDTSKRPEGVIKLLNAWMEQDIEERIDSREALIRCLEQKYIAVIEATYQTRSDDRDLVLEAKFHADSFACLYQKYHLQVRAFFAHRVEDLATAEDFTHETFERAFKALPSYTPSNASYLTYLLRIAHNLLVSHYRKQSRTINRGPGVQDLQKEIERKDALQRGLTRLSSTDRKVILMKYRDGMRVKEIATELKKSENAVKLQLSRARKKLRQIV